MFKRNNTIIGVKDHVNLSAILIVLSILNSLQLIWIVKSSSAATIPELVRGELIIVENYPPNVRQESLDRNSVNQTLINNNKNDGTANGPSSVAILQKSQNQRQQASVFEKLLHDFQENKTQITNGVNNQQFIQQQQLITPKNGEYHRFTGNKTRRSLFNSNEQELNSDCEFTISRKPAIYGVRCETCEYHSDGAIIIPAHNPTKIYLIGKNLYSNISVALTAIDGAQQDDCTHNDRIKTFQLFNISLNVGEIEIELPSQGMKIPYYFCIREAASSTGWFHQGSDAWLKLYVKQDYLPTYGKLLLIAFLLSLSGTFSGLNLGLMSLDKNDLQVIIKCGSENEKRYARTIEPVRRRGNYLLCSILFSNTLVNSTISVLLEDLSGGLIAIMFSTILIVLFGEILPQAFCSRHGLAVGAKTIWLTQTCMILTFPLSYPVSWCLDLALGDELGHVYDRERLMEFINLTKEYNQLETDEVNIISGALKLKRIEVREIMTKIDDVYMLDETACLDYATIQAIVEKGYSRVPIHKKGDRNDILALLFAKDLALSDPDDKTPVSTFINFYSHPIIYLHEDDKLDYALNLFKSGQAHMGFVRRVVNDGDRDPYHENMGIVTLEDVIEEIMQIEINDETDTLTDNRRKRRRKDAQVRTDFSHFTNLGSGDAFYNVVSPKQSLAAYQYLATTVEPFSAKYLSDSVLKRLVCQKIYYKVKMEDDDRLKSLYVAGKPADYFIMILEGRVEVKCGQENLRFYMGPFDCFGESALLGLIKPKQTPMAIGGPPPTTTSDLATPDANSTPSHLHYNNHQHHLNQQQPFVSSRRESMAPKILSRRESLTKVITGQLSLSMKKLSDQIQPVSGQVEHLTDATASTTALPMSNISPTSATNIAKLIGSEPTSPYHIVPDYTVNVIADTSYLKVTTNDYLTSLKATALERNSTGIDEEIITMANNNLYTNHQSEMENDIGDDDDHDNDDDDDDNDDDDDEGTSLNRRDVVS